MQEKNQNKKLTLVALHGNWALICSLACFWSLNWLNFFKPYQDLLDKIRKEWKVLSVVDIVLNHSANNSPWLWKHPECAYNLENSPHLKPAFLLDRALWHFSCQVADGLWTSDGLPPEINTEEHVHRFGEILRWECLYLLIYFIIIIVFVTWRACFTLSLHVRFQNSGLWNLEIWIPDPANNHRVSLTMNLWNPKSKTVFDYLTWAVET